MKKRILVYLILLFIILVILFLGIKTYYLIRYDYKGEIKGFTVGNDYIAEGTFYIDHRWEIKQ